jgi:hypothetical protein
MLRVLVETGTILVTFSANYAKARVAPGAFPLITISWALVVRQPVPSALACASKTGSPRPSIRADAARYTVAQQCSYLHANSVCLKSTMGFPCTSKRNTKVSLR